jgi:hypothetical protein
MTELTPQEARAIARAAARRGQSAMRAVERLLETPRRSTPLQRLRAWWRTAPPEQRHKPVRPQPPLPAGERRR